MIDDKVSLNIYAVDGIDGENKIKFVHVDFVEIKTNEFVPDTYLTTFMVDETIYGRVFACNLTDHYIQTNNKIPIIYAVVEYQKQLLKSELLKIRLCFDMDHKQKKTLDTLMDTEFTGKFYLEVDMDDNTTELDEDLKVFPGKKELIDKIIKFVKNSEMVEIFNFKKDEIESKRYETYRKYYENIKVPEVTFSIKDIIEKEENELE